jgi:hypothetical protein
MRRFALNFTDYERMHEILQAKYSIIMHWHENFIPPAARRMGVQKTQPIAE